MLLNADSLRDHVTAYRISDHTCARSYRCIPLQQIQQPCGGVNTPPQGVNTLTGGHPLRRCHPPPGAMTCSRLVIQLGHSTTPWCCWSAVTVNGPVSSIGQSTAGPHYGPNLIRGVVNTPSPPPPPYLYDNAPSIVYHTHTYNTPL